MNETPPLVVIFRARIKQPDAQYATTAARLRELALTQFGCLAFHACTQGQDEIALSYWPDEQHIRAWREHPEHLEAQRLGQTRWYASYAVDIARIERSYPNPEAS